MSPTHPLDPRVQRTRHDVIEAATEIFLADGWSAVTHAAVAKRAGYAKATVYAHWPTRLDLVGDAVEQICESAQHAPPTGDLRADLRRELTTFAGLLTHGHLARVLGGVLERAGSDPGVDRLRDRLHDEGTGTLDEVLRAHLPAADVEPTMALLVGAVLFRAGFHRDAVSPAFVEDLIDRVLASLSSGSRATPRPARGSRPGGGSRPA